MSTHGMTRDSHAPLEATGDRRSWGEAVRDMSHLTTRAIRWTSHTSHGGGTGTFLHSAPKVLFYEIFLGWRFSRTKYQSTADNDSANVTSTMIARSQPTSGTAGEQPGRAAPSHPATPRLEEPENPALNTVHSYEGWRVGETSHAPPLWDPQPTPPCSAQAGVLRRSVLQSLSLHPPGYPQK